MSPALPRRCGSRATPTWSCCSLGEPELCTGEAASRGHLSLTGRQRELAEAVLEVGKPTVVLLSSGRPLTVSWLIERAQAVMALWFPGIETGNAVAELLLGHASPSGKLAVSWPRSTGQIPIFYAQRSTGRPFSATDMYTSGYLDTPVTPQFPFGHGLSYSRFEFPHPAAASATFGQRTRRSQRKPTSPTPGRWPARKPCCCSCATWWRVRLPAVMELRGAPPG